MAMLPEKLEDFLQYYATDAGKADARHFQKTFNTVLNRKAAKTHVDSLPTAYQKARVAVNAMKGASRVLRVLPTGPSKTLSDSVMRITVNDKLGLPPISEMKHLVECSCGQKITAKNHYRHFLDCQKTKPQATHGHDEMGQLVLLNAKRAGATYAQWNPRMELYDKRLIPDSEMRTDEFKFVEYMITDGTAESNLDKVKRNPYDLTRHWEGKKTEKYQGLAAKCEAKIVPFIVEAQGGLGEKAREFVKELAALATSRRSPWSARSIHQGLLDDIAIAIARRNAKISTESRSRATSSITSNARQTALQHITIFALSAFVHFS